MVRAQGALLDALWNLDTSVSHPASPRCHLVPLPHSPTSGQVPGSRLRGGGGGAQRGLTAPAQQHREPPKHPSRASEPEHQVTPAHQQPCRGQEEQHAVQAHSLQQPHGESCSPPSCCHLPQSPKVSVLHWGVTSVQLGDVFLSSAFFPHCCMFSKTLIRSLHQASQAGDCR